MGDDAWCTIESDPGVFTELIERIGVEDVQVEELYGFDEASFAQLHPIYGLVFLFKWTGEKDERPTVNPDDQPGLFFAHQVITNACATQAILSVLLNCDDKIKLGDTLTEFKSFTSEFPPDMKGLAISNSDKIRSVHNSFARQEPFVNDSKDDNRKKEDAFHFVAYLPYKGKVYELDGLKRGPVVLGDEPGEDGDGGDEVDRWLEVVSPAIRQRISKYSSEEIRFNLLAIVKNRRLVAAESQARSMRRVEAIDRALESGDGGEDVDLSSTDSSFVLAQGRESLEAQRAEEVAASEEHGMTIANEDVKIQQWRAENVRRKHNYVPFTSALLKLLAQQEDLKPILDLAMRRAKEQRDARMAEAKRTKTTG